MTKTENITKERRDFHLFREIAPKIHWEANGMVKSNPRIDKNKIFGKCSTSEFPADSISVRVNSMKNKRYTVYFYGKATTRSWNNGQQHYTYINQALKVSCDHSMIRNPDIRKPLYSFMGEMPHGLTPDEVAFALNHIGDILYGEQ